MQGNSNAATSCRFASSKPSEDIFRSSPVLRPAYTAHTSSKHVPGEEWSPGWPAYVCCAGLLLIRYEQAHHACVYGPPACCSLLLVITPCTIAQTVGVSQAPRAAEGAGLLPANHDAAPCSPCATGFINTLTFSKGLSGVAGHAVPPSHWAFAHLESICVQHIVHSMDAGSA
jgi:hypothetical protein